MNLRWTGFAVVCLCVAGCKQDKPPHAWQGYAEGEYVRVASSVGGTLVELRVRQGDRVERGAPLFALERESEAAARREAEKRRAEAAARLANLEKGRRPDEIAAIEAQQRQAQAVAQLSSATLKRTEALVASGFQSPATLDEARSARDRDLARVGELAAQLRVARLPARGDEIRAARAELEAAQAVVAQADWRIGQKDVPAPAGGTIQDRLYLPGEFVPPGNAVVSLLPPENIKVRFFVPEPDLARVGVGRRVAVSCDGCGAGYAGTVSFVSTQAEYTPPVIYNRENRSKLVYLVEARFAPTDAVKLHPGQPVDVRLP